MTYNQVKKEMEAIAGSHAMIMMVKNCRPEEWLQATKGIKYPCCCYWITGGEFDKGNMHNYAITFWFLDKAGQEYLHEGDVVSDMEGVAGDIVSLLRDERKPYIIDDSISWTAVYDKYEDYLAGVQLSLNIETVSPFDGCDVPIK